VIVLAATLGYIIQFNVIIHLVSSMDVFPLMKKYMFTNHVASNAVVAWRL
jgi:hypothetical protein